MALKFRRGTTAQKSGSLAFGEPYLNSDLGTLQVGGPSGDITLGAVGAGSDLEVNDLVANDITASGNLHVVGNAAIDGNLTLGGQITIGDNTSDIVNVVASLSSSLIPQTSNAFDLGSAQKFWKDLYISTGSIKFVDNSGTIVGTLTGNASGDLKITGELSGSSISGLGNATAFSTSVDSRLDVVEGLSASVKTVTDTFATSASVATATANSISSLSSSVKTVTDTFATSASVATATSNSISTLSASVAAEQYAKLNSNNVFTGTQTITGSLFVSANLIVQGSSSLQNITASAASIGTNTVILNTSTPSVRFGGIAVQDSGSGAGASGSLLWDSQNDVWIYQQPAGAPEGYGSARLIAGPQNTGSLGEEIGLTTTYIPVAVGDDHIGDSNVKVVDNDVTIEAGNLYVEGEISASTINGIGNVTAYSTSVASRVNTLETAGYALSSSVASATATSITSLSSSVKAVTDTFATSASVALATAASITSISSSVKAVTDTFATSASVASATAASITSLSSSVKTVTDTFATSASVASATAASISTLSGSVFTTYAKLAGANTFTANQIVSGSITATGDVVAYSTSDKRHKNNIVNITDALAKVTKLNGVTWEWNDDVDAATKETPKTGLIAQEVQEVLPEVVKERGDGFLALDYSKTIGLLVEAIKEQQTQIHSLTLEVEKLKKNNSL